MNLINQIAEKISVGLGFEASKKDVTANINKSLIDLSTCQSHCLSDYLYHRYYDSKDQLFFLESKVVGFMFEIQPIVGVDESLVKNLDYFFNNELPHDSWIQFCLVASNDVDNILEKYTSSSVNPNPVLKKLIHRHKSFVSKIANNFGDYDGRLARNFRIFVSVSKFCKLDKGNALREIGEIKSLKKNLFNKFETLRLVPRICNDKDLIEFSKELFECNVGNDFRANSKKVTSTKVSYSTLDRKMLSDSMRYKLNDRELINITNSSTTRCYREKELPGEWSLLKMINLLGCSSRENLGIPAKFVISYTIAASISEPGQSGVRERGKRVIHAAEQWYARNNINLQRDAIEWRDINDKAKGGERFLTESFQVILTSPNDKIEEAEQALLSLYRVLDWQLVPNDKFHLPIILSCVPMQQPIYWDNLLLYKKADICMGSQVTAKLPIHAEWKGVPQPGVLFFGRRGQLFHWNPFYRISSGNYNVCVLGPSGGGKSVFLQSLSTNMMAQNTRIFILDIGQSFAEIANLLGGEIIQFSKEVKFTLNPFSGFSKKMLREDFHNLVKCSKELLIIMCGVRDDRGAAELEKAIVDSLEKFDYRIDINVFADYLMKTDSTLLREYAITLYSYTKEGIYGKYFTNDMPAKFDKDMTVFEFEEIKQDKKLLAIILQILLIEITNQFFVSSYRDQQFMIIVDEAWMLLDYSAGFFAEFARTVRKYGGSLVTCVQNFSDLQKTDQHKAILENSTWTILLKQDEKGLSAFKESEAFKDKLHLIKSVSLVPGKYSEMLISATGVNVVGRLVLDEYSSALYSTDSADFNYLKRAQDDNISLDAAIERLAKRKYVSK